MRPRHAGPTGKTRTSERPQRETPGPSRPPRRTSGKPAGSAVRQAPGQVVAGLAPRASSGWRSSGSRCSRSGWCSSPSPTPRPTSPTPTRGSRPRRATSTTPTARPCSASSPSRTAPASTSPTSPTHVQDAVVAAEDRTVLDQQGHRPQGHPAGGLQQRPRRRHPGRLDDHPAVRQGLLPHARSAPGPARLKEAILSLKIQRQESKEEILQGYLNTIYFGRGAYGIEAASRAYFRSPAQAADRPGGRGAGGDHQLARTTTTRRTARRRGSALQRALRLRPRRHGRHRARCRRSWPRPRSSTSSRRSPR